MSVKKLSGKLTYKLINRTTILFGSLISLISGLIYTVYAQVNLTINSETIHITDTLNLLIPIKLTDSIHIIDTVSNLFATILKLTDTIHVLDNLGAITNSILKLFDTIIIIDNVNNILQQIINQTVTVTITMISVITSLASGNQSFQYTGDNNSALSTQVIVPAILIIINIYPLLKWQIQSVGIMVMLESFVILGLSAIGIIPNYFILIIIVFIAIGILRLFGKMTGGNQ